MNHPSSKLKLLLPGLLGPMPNIASCGVELAVQGIERVLARADRISVPGRDYLSTLYGLFGLAESDMADLPEGAVSYLAEGGVIENYCFLRADPVHLRADRDRLLLFDGGYLAIHPEEAEAIAREFNQHFAAEGMRLLTPHPQRWYLRLEQCPALRTASLYKVVGQHIESFMPSGEDARIWKQRLNETQMLLFQSPVNRQREASGRLTINGIWFSGSGRLPSLSPITGFKVVADELNALGLAQHAGLQSIRLSAVDMGIWPADESCMMVWMDLVTPVLHADPSAWVEAMQLVEGRLQGLTESMRKQGQSCLELYPCNGQVFSLTPSNLRRFWRRRRKMIDYLD
ncbi:MAG: phosphoglycerate mutase [Chromatiales bacterium]|jgi:hypothetical protein